MEIQIQEQLKGGVLPKFINTFWFYTHVIKGEHMVEIGNWMRHPFPYTISILLSILSFSRTHYS